MRIFRRKKPEKTEKQVRKQLAASIRDIPNYQKAVEFLQDWFDHKVNVDRHIMPECMGDLEAEIAMDKETPVWMLYPSSLNEKGDFSHFLDLPLNALNAGVYMGTLVVGKRKTVINRNFVDGFIHCMEDVYGFPCQRIRALVNKTKAYPIFLISDLLSFVIAPIIGLERNIHELSWETGKFNPETKILSQQQDIPFLPQVPDNNISIDLNKLLLQVKDGGIVAVYRCPHCGASLKVGKNTQVEQLATCEHCGSKIDTMDIADFLKTVLS